jgi:hypothetical protein
MPEDSSREISRPHRPVANFAAPMVGAADNLAMT